MSTWTEFYIQNTEKNKVVEKLKSLTSIQASTVGIFPKDFHSSYLLDENPIPDYLIIGNTQPDWIRVIHNSLKKINNWGEVLSRAFETKVIMTMAQSVSDGYYFALYDNGNLVREIEICYGDGTEMVNYGTKFDFEGPEPGKKLKYEDEYIFDFDSIEEYCRQFGLIIQLDENSVTWTILKGNSRRKRVTDFLQELTEPKKPWWKIW